MCRSRPRFFAFRVFSFLLQIQRSLVSGSHRNYLATVIFTVSSTFAFSTRLPMYWQFLCGRIFFKSFITVISLDDRARSSSLRDALQGEICFHIAPYHKFWGARKTIWGTQHMVRFHSLAALLTLRKRKFRQNSLLFLEWKKMRYKCI